MKRRRRWQLGAVAGAITVAGIAATGALVRSHAQGEIAALRDRASVAAREAATRPEWAAGEASAVWHDMANAAATWGSVPGLASELDLARADAERALYTVLSGRPGWVATLVDAREDPLIETSGDGTLLVVSGTNAGEHAIELWTMDGETSWRVSQVVWPQQVQCLSVRQDGRQMVAASRRYIGIWDLGAAGVIERERRIDLAAAVDSAISCSSIATRPDGGRAYVGTSDGEIHVLDLHSLQMRQIDVSGFDGIVNDLEVTPDGESLFAAVWQGSPALYRLHLNEAVSTAIPLDGEPAPRALAFSVDGSSVYSGHESGVVTARSLRTGEIRWSRRLPGASITTLSATPDGLVAGDEDGRIHLIASDRVEGLITVPMATSVITGARRVSGGAVAVSAAGEPIRLWHPERSHPTETLLGRDTKGGAGLALSEDGTLTAFGDNALVQWKHDGARWETSGHRHLDLPAGWTIVAASGDGKHVALTAAYAVESTDKVLRLFVADATYIELKGFTAKLPHGAFDASGNLLGVTDLDRPLRVAIWDVRQPWQPRHIFTVADGVGGAELAFSSEAGSIAVVGLDGCVYVWSLASESQHRKFCDLSKPAAVAFGGPASEIAVGSMDGPIQILRETDGAFDVEVLHGHKAATTALAFDNSGRWLVTASDDGEMRVWNTVTWQEVGRMSDPDESFVRQITATPDPARLLTLTQGGRRISEWNLAPPRLAERARLLSKPLESGR